MFLRPGLMLAVLIAPVVQILTACTTPQAAVKNVVAPPESPYQRQFNTDAVSACAAANRALLGDGYLTEPVGNEKIKGRKSYRNDSDHSTVVEMTISCLPNPDSSSNLYANGLRSTYELKKSTIPASVGVSVFGSLSLPIGQSADSMVKTTDETISEPVFYRNFFTAVETVLLRINTENNAQKETASPAATSTPTSTPAAKPLTP